jgi:alkanesulfonate monooxygenase SsuD/methylene tetrahydromethanopterin reductase-like flavin-dependent oxidoreductase (luciferase family)
MEFGLFTELASPPRVSEAAAFDESPGLMKAAEKLGYDAAWLAEIHFQKDDRYLRHPRAIGAALAASTRRVKIGIAVQVVPLSPAEDVEAGLAPRAERPPSPKGESRSSARRCR